MMVKRWLVLLYSFLLIPAVTLAVSSPLYAASAGQGDSDYSIDFAGEVIVTTQLVQDRVVIDIGKSMQLQGALQPKLQLRCSHTQKSATFQCGYALQHTALAIEALLWGGEWSERRWNDPLQLVRLPGAAAGSTRLRLQKGASSLDIGPQQVATRWETQQSGSGGSALLGVLTLWGANIADDEDDLCVTDPLHEACDGYASESSTPGLLLMPSAANAELPVATSFHFNRAVAYISADTSGWRWQGALASAVCAPGSTAAAAGFSAHYRSAHWRTELYTKYEADDYRKPGGPAVFVLQPTIAVKHGSLTTEGRLRLEGDDVLSKHWRFILAGRANITINQVNSVYTQHQIETAKKPAWRLLLDVQSGPGSVSTTCGTAPCPWLWPDDSISAWTIQAEGVMPSALGQLGARLKVGESRSGRLNWWYTRPAGKRALSSQSNIGITLEGKIYRAFGAWQYQLSILSSEEIQFRYNSWEKPNAYYWCVEPTVRYTDENYTVSGALLWARGQEFDGVSYWELIPTLELAIKL